MTLDLPHRHAAGVHRDDLLVEAREPPFVLGDQLRLEVAGTITRYRDLHPPRLPDQRLLREAVAMIAGPGLPWFNQMVRQLGVQSLLRECFLQL